MEFTKLGPNELECYITTELERLDRDKHSSLLDPFVRAKNT